MFLKLNKHYFLWSAIVLIAFLIRILFVNISPPSLYWEEVALGYDAYSILKTGADHHNNTWPIVALNSFGDWKPSGYFYSLVPFIWIFGLNTLSVKLPSILAGTVFVVSVGAIVNEIGKIAKLSNKHTTNLTSLALFISAISPWGFLLSRVGFETNLATAFTTCAIAILIKSKNNFGTLVSAVLIAAATYTYHSTRVIAPALFILFLVFKNQSLQRISLDKIVKNSFLPTLTLLILMLPIAWSTFSSGQVSDRFAETSIFSDISVIEESNRLISDSKLPFANIIHHRFLLYGQKIVENALSHLSPSFLFIDGDANIRHSSGVTGQLYWFEILFILFGCYWIYKNSKWTSLMLLGWSILALLPSSVTMAVPHALRSQLLHPVLLILITFGIFHILNYLQAKNKNLQKVTLVLILTSYICSFLYMYNHLLKVYPVMAQHEWQYGYEQLIDELNTQISKNNPDKVLFSREKGRPAMYYWFYSETPPAEVQLSEPDTAKDQGEVLEYKNILFASNPEEIVEQLNSEGVVLVVGSEETLESVKNLSGQSNLQRVSEIRDLSGEIVWTISKIQN